MSKHLKIGVFGGGRGAALMHVLLHHPNADLIAVCDKYEPLLEQAKARAEELKVEVALYRDFDEFIRHPGMDAVILANYATEHAAYAIRCMNAGKHVLSECLPCETMAQAVALIECVEETGMVYAFAENCCYMPHTFEMWRRYENGEIGEACYGEGEYIHDCSSIWPQITYGDRNHWRNRMHANFYCTHSIGPLLTITGLRPVQVIGMENVPPKHMMELGSIRGAGIEMITMNNGAIFKSLHGDLKREPGGWNFIVYGSKGMIESGRFPENKNTNVYREGERNCVGTWEKLDAKTEVASEITKLCATEAHGGADFYAVHFFIEKILGKPNGRFSIDVYTAVDMGITGLLAYRSALAGNKPIRVPNLRNLQERDEYRNDNACTTPAVAGDQLLPVTSHSEMLHDLSDEVYDRVRQLWLDGKQA